MIYRTPLLLILISWLTFDDPDSEEAFPLEGISGPGDSGGPALWFDGNQAYIMGVSYHQNGRGLGNPEGVYSVYEFYTRVSAFADWVQDELKKYDIDLN